MLKTFIEECGFVASGHEWSRGIPDLIALAPLRHESCELIDKGKPQTGHGQ
jgi:hypothetical protein